MLRKIGIDESYLKCGPHDPYSPEAAKALRESGQAPTALHNNCSGKHAGMLAVARQIEAPVDTYDQPDNPVQLMIARVIEQFSDVPADQIVVGIDGCGLPCFAVSLHAMALMFARLINPVHGWNEKTKEACRRIVAAMVTYPEMIGGRTNSQDTALMNLTGSKLIAKAGAEGIFTGAVFPSEKWQRGLAIALKIEDGDPGKRARRPTVTEIFRQLGVLSDEQARDFKPYGNSTIHNHREERVGEIRAAFALELEDRS
jgi:L-asparaginase II